MCAVVGLQTHSIYLREQVQCAGDFSVNKDFSVNEDTSTNSTLSISFFRLLDCVVLNPYRMQTHLLKDLARILDVQVQ